MDQYSQCRPSKRFNDQWQNIKSVDKNVGNIRQNLVKKLLSAELEMYFDCEMLRSESVLFENVNKGFYGDLRGNRDLKLKNKFVGVIQSLCNVSGQVCAFDNIINSHIHVSFHTTPIQYSVIFKPKFAIFYHHVHNFITGS